MKSAGVSENDCGRELKERKCESGFSGLGVCVERGHLVMNVLRHWRDLNMENKSAGYWVWISSMDGTARWKSTKDRVQGSMRSVSGEAITLPCSRRDHLPQPSMCAGPTLSPLLSLLQANKLCVACYHNEFTDMQNYVSTFPIVTVSHPSIPRIAQDFREYIFSNSELAILASEFRLLARKYE